MVDNVETARRMLRAHIEALREHYADPAAGPFGMLGPRAQGIAWAYSVLPEPERSEWKDRAATARARRERKEGCNG